MPNKINCFLFRYKNTEKTATFVHNFNKTFYVRYKRL